MIRLVQLHRLNFKYGAGDPLITKGDPLWINPTFVVAVLDWSRSGKRGATLRLHGDETHQDWTQVWESQTEVVALLGNLAP